MSSLRKNVASQHIGFCLNSTAAGAPVTAGGAGTIVIDGGAQAACGGTFTHKGTGQWDYAPTQAETNGTSISFAFTGTGAIQVGMQFFTIGYDPTVANLPANVIQVNGTAQTARDLGASVLLSAGTGTGQLDFTSGVVKANLAQILGTALTETAGQIAAAFKQFFNIGSPTSTMNTITAVTTAATATNLTNAPTNGDFTAAMKTSLNAATPASVQNISAQTGDSFARIGLAGVGLTNLGDARLADLDAAVSSRATPAQLLTTALTESYAALHAVPTLTQLLLEVRALLAETSISGTTLTTNKIDGTTAAHTYTLNSSTAPTSLTTAS